MTQDGWQPLAGRLQSKQNSASTVIQPLQQFTAVRDLQMRTAIWLTPL